MLQDTTRGTIYAIEHRAGFVHRIRDGDTCRTLATASSPKRISLTQAMVYALPACRDCWPDLREFKHVVREGQSR